MGTAYAGLWTVLGGVVTVLGAIIVAKITGRSSENAAVEPIRVKAEQDAFEAAARYWQAQINDQAARIETLTATVGRLETKVDTLGRTSEENERKNRRRIRQLENELITHNITVPEWDPAT
ncbi:hypothetical protein L1080_004310 [Rhodococcus sp. MSC1_016]|jgi:TolA-binding protein|uniref:hypothetical protein n=1 Tax=Rhodococcus sp. MSC1_016 TaxID=2909266 RepID=UPI002030EED1|nr:hypothetical protein [Rhodococcus sp. MSC1_016]